MREQIDTLEDALRLDDKHPPSTPEHSTKPAKKSLPQLVNHAQHRAWIRDVVQKKARRIGALEDMTVLEAPEDAFFGLLPVRLQVCERRTEKLIFQFSGACANTRSTHGSIGRLTWQKH